MKEKGYYCGECEEKLTNEMTCPNCKKEFPIDIILHDKVQEVTDNKFGSK